MSQQDRVVERAHVHDGSCSGRERCGSGAARAVVCGDDDGDVGGEVGGESRSSEGGGNGDAAVAAVFEGCLATAKAAAVWQGGSAGGLREVGAGRQDEQRVQLRRVGQRLTIARGKRHRCFGDFGEKTKLQHAQRASWS